jgi:hypothetical protein
MHLKPFIKVGSDANVVLIWNFEALDEVDVLHEAVPLRTQDGASGDSLR